MSAVAHQRATIARQRTNTAPVAETPQRNSLDRFDDRLGALLGADIRLIYGMGVPMVCVLAAMIAMFKHPSYVLVAGLLVFELLCLVLIVGRSFTLLDESDGAETDHRADAALIPVAPGGSGVNCSR